MAYFTAYFQKKALRFALSQLGLFDEHAFDLESPGISWGVTTVIELRDVPLSLSRLTELLQLPRHVRLVECCISLLRLTLPLNFVSNNIEIEVEGVKVKLAISTNNEKTDEGNVKANRTKTSGTAYSKAGNTVDNTTTVLPTVDDLANSFLASQSVHDKVELRSAIAESRLSRSQLPSEEAEDIGLGPDVSLNSVLSNFARGVLDRVRARIKNIQIEVAFKSSVLSLDGIEHSQAAEEITFCLDIDTIDGPPVAQGDSAHNADSPTKDDNRPKRNVSVTGIHGSILATSALSSFMTQLSRSPSPTLSRAASKVSDTMNSPQSTSDLHRLRSALRTENTSLTASASESGDSLEGLQGFKASSRFGSRRIWSQSSLKSSPPQSTDEQPPVGFGEDSQALDDPEELDFRGDYPSLSPLSSALEHSALSESSQSFLSKSPTGPRGLSTGSALSMTLDDHDRGPPSFDGYETPVAQAADDAVEDLTESKFFSAEEARSIYMSAMSTERRRDGLSADTIQSRIEPDEPDSPHDVFHDARSGLMEQSTVTPREQSLFSQGGEAVTKGHGSQNSALIDESSDDDSPPASLLVASFVSAARDELGPVSDPLSDQQSNSFELPQVGDSKSTSNPQIRDERLPINRTATVKTLLFVDSIHIQLPAAASQSIPQETQAGENLASERLPGTFSYHSAMALPADTSANVDNRTVVDPEPQALQDTNETITIRIPTIVVCFDMAILRLAITISNSLPNGRSEHRTHEASSRSTAASMIYGLNIQRTVIRFEQALKTHHRHSSDTLLEFADTASQSSSDDLLRCIVRDLNASSRTQKQEMHIEVAVSKFTVGFPDENIIAFNRDLKMRESVRDIMTPSLYDISIKVIQSPATSDQIEVNTAPLHIKLNVNRLAEVINWLGGLSTVIDLGNSVKSSVTISGSPRTSAGPKAQGVRFDIKEAADVTMVHAMPTPKCNIRFGGLAVDVIGKDAAILIEGSALKVVVRDGATRAQIDHINLYGPILQDNTKDPAVILHIHSLALSYFDLPKENDLTRLLALLSPSQDRDEQDDDILLDTLLRQRRKGGVLRINITKAKARISQSQQFHHFNTLVEEASQLSSVAKYLPEDDRPGLLILLAVDGLQANVDVDRSTNSLSLSVQSLQLALVTFPSLFLVAISNINATHAGKELIGRAMPDVQTGMTRKGSSSEDIPQVSMKFIAGEMEPTVRLKFNGVRFEYHVSTVMSFLDVSETASGDVIVAEMVNTVANLAAVDNKLGQSLLFEETKANVKKEKPFRIDVVVRDTTIGFNPVGKPGHGLLVLTKCRLCATHAEEDSLGSHASLELIKASLLIIDEKNTSEVSENVKTPNVVSGLGSKPTQVQCLEALGYVSVAEISAAKVLANLKEQTSGPLLDVQVRNDLFVLETCADSTQTLIGILGGLTPPMPPREGKKYRTEVVPIENMLASFTGDAFPTDSLEEDDTDYAMSSDDETDAISLGDRDDSTRKTFNNVVDLSIDSSDASFGLGSVIFRHPNVSDRDRSASALNFQEEAQTASSLHFEEDHFGKADGGLAKEWNSYKNSYDAVDPTKIRNSPLQIHFDDVHFIWNLFDGYDWQRTRDTITQAVEDVEAKAEERRAARRDKLRHIDDDETEAIIGDMLFNSIYIGISAKDDPRELSRRVNGILNDDSSDTGSYATSTTIASGHVRQTAPLLKKKRLRLGRSKHHKMTFEVKGISGSIISFPPDSGETQSSINIKIRDLEIFDNVPTSTWKKFATYLHDAGSRQLGSNMVHIEMLLVKPNHDLLASEFVLKVAVLPLRLHVDQDALDFLTRFFEFREDGASEPVASSDPPFIQRAEIGPVQIKLDFKPKRVDWKALRSGKTAEFMNFIILDEADMILRRIILYGVRGFDKLGRSLNDIWTPDVRTNQLPGVLAGLAPVRPLVNVGLGVRDLVVIPMREYKKDGRLVRAVRKGVVSFGKTTTTELAKLGAKLAIGTHTMLSGAEGLLAPDVRTPGPYKDDQDPSQEQATLSPYADQPIGVVQGLRGAYRGLERDLLLAKDAIVAMPGEIMDSEDASGAAAAFLRTAPVVILRPAMGISKAVGQTLLGATNSLDKTERRRIEDKYKHR